MTASEIQAHLYTLGDPAKAAHAQGFFKTKPGEYGEGDIFRGIRVPELRKTARMWRKLPLEEAIVLLHSPYHEDRFVALCILVHIFDVGTQEAVYHTYLQHTRFVNNWDLVDASAHKIVGAYLFNRDRTPLYKLARSSTLWERRIAIIATYYFIQRDEFADTLALCELLLQDTHDLMHKAMGWMLREVGKRDQVQAEMFLAAHCTVMPRTMLRYAIERFDEPRRQAYLQGKVKPDRRLACTWRAYCEVMQAALRLQGHVKTTPLVQAKTLGRENDTTVYLKLESEQYTGSFKYRGALNKLLTLEGHPVVAASTGNHGLAVTRAMQALSLDGCIYLPENADEYKVKALRENGAILQFSGEDGVEAELAARREAEKQGHTFVSPYNDWVVVGGQGTIGLELLQQTKGLDCVMAAVGGGGLISGLAAVLKARNSDVQIIGCSPERSPVMHESVRAERIVAFPVQPTLADGTAGGIERNSITLPLCCVLVDQWVTASEAEIAAGMRRIYLDHGKTIEGAAGVVVACYLKLQDQLKGLRVALIICGGNVEHDRFEAIINSIEE